MGLRLPWLLTNDPGSEGTWRANLFGPSVDSEAREACWDAYLIYSRYFRSSAMVLALQEMDRGQPRSGLADLTDVAAEALGAAAHRFVPALTGTPDRWVAATPDDPPDAPAYGVALLSRHPVSRWRVLRLPAFRGPAPMWWPDARHPSLSRDEPRIAVAADVG